MLHAPHPEKLRHRPGININAIGVVVACSNSLKQRREVDAQPHERIREGWRHHAGWAGEEVQETDAALPKKGSHDPRHVHDDETQREPA